MIHEGVMNYLRDIKADNVRAIENETQRVRDDEEARHARVRAAGMLGVVGWVKNLTSQPAEINATLVRFCERRIRDIVMTMGELQMGNTVPAEDMLVDAVLGGAKVLRIMVAFDDSPHEWSEISAQVRQNFALLEDLNAEKARNLAATRKELQSVVGI